MQLTPNYKLKKPESTDPIDIQDLNDNADILDAELKKKADLSGGDISGMTVKTLDTVSTAFPVPVAGESTKTFLGKIRKFFEDTKSWMTGVCLLSQLVNNCVTDNPNLPLAAAQGKVLMDLYTVLNTNFTKLDSDLGDGIIFRGSITGDLNRTDIKPGYYKINDPGSVTNANNASWCTFIQFSAYNTQMIIGAGPVKCRKRSGNPAAWGAWE